MAVRIALAFSPECEKELIAAGFKKQEVYISHDVKGLDTKEQVSNGDRAFYEMEHPPYQFVTTSWWGACND
jgi:hypothetical protein